MIAIGKSPQNRFIHMILNNIKKLITHFDKRFQTNFLEKVRSIDRSDLLNSVRRKTTPLIINLRYRIRINQTSPLRLHLGCGKRKLKGYVNIDWRKTKATDLVCNILKIPYPENTVDTIEIYHVIEHLPRHEFPKALKEWFRVMSPGGQLIIEYPDFDQAVKDYLEGNENRIDNIFGLQRFPGDTHLFGYNFKRLKKLLKQAGFTNIKNEVPTDYHVELEPCLRIECSKVDQ
jgi:predicted SAM-dependent methyltransferase